MNTLNNITERAMAIIENRGIDWTIELQEIVQHRARTCDGKDTPTQIASFSLSLYNNTKG